MTSFDANSERETHTSLQARTLPKQNQQLNQNTASYQDVEQSASSPVTNGKNNENSDYDRENGYRLKFCCGLPYSIRRWICILVVVLGILISGVAIAAQIVSQQRAADIPSIVYGKGSQGQTLESETIIIGAGAAGLFAGYTLKYLGIESFTILEADDHIGGRTWQSDSFIPEVPLDLGAEWIHVDPSVLKNLLLFEDTDDLNSELLPETIKYRPSTWTTTVNGKTRHRDWIRWFYSETKFLDSTWWAYLNDFVYSRIADKIRLNNTVELIDYSDPNQIRVVTTTGLEYVGSQVILAVPIGILQSEGITFDPAAPITKTRAWNSIEYTPGLKAWFEFDDRFYPDVAIPGSLLSFATEDKMFFDALYGKQEVTMGRNVMALFEVGPTAETKVEWTDERIVAEALKDLDGMFDGKASQHIVQTLVQHWTKETNIKGVYSYNWLEYWKEISTLRESIDKRIYFCGEYLAEHSATVHGAAISGRNVVRRIIDDRQEQ